jgi:hypothetical protein
MDEFVDEFKGSRFFDNDRESSKDLNDKRNLLLHSIRKGFKEDPVKLPSFPSSFHANQYELDELEQERLSELRGLVYDQCEKRAGLCKLRIDLDESQQVVKALINELMDRGFDVNDEIFHGALESTYRLFSVVPLGLTDNDYFVFEGYSDIFGT